MYDSDYCGLVDGEQVLCKHNCVAAKFVCFEGHNTGRRFLACAGQLVFKDCTFSSFSILILYKMDTVFRI